MKISSKSRHFCFREWRHIGVMAPVITGKRHVVAWFVQAYSNGIIQGPHNWPLCEGNPPITDGFLSQMTNNAESVPMSWRLREPCHGVPDIVAYSVATAFNANQGFLFNVLHNIIMNPCANSISGWYIYNVQFGVLCRCISRSMMTSSNGNIFRVTGHLCGEITGPQWIPLTKASDAELWCFLWFASE